MGLADRSDPGPWVVHYCEVYNVTYSKPDGSDETLIFDKRAVNRSLQAEVKAESIPNVSSLLDCRAPLFEVPPTDAFSRGGKAPTRVFNQSAWIMCTALRAVNTGLRRYRERHCPAE